LNNYTYLDIVP